MRSRRAVLLLLASSPLALVPGMRLLGGRSSGAQPPASTPGPWLTAPNIPTPTPTPTPDPYIHIPQVASDGIPPTVSISNEFPLQGGAILVSVSAAQSGVAHFLGRSFVLAPNGEGGVDGFVAVDAEDPVGAARIDIDIVEHHGGEFRVTRTVTVRRTEWTVDYIWIPEPDPTEEPDPGTTPEPTPTPPPDEGPLLPQVYAGVTERKWRPGWAHPLGEGFEVTGRFGEQRSFNGGPVQGHHGGTDFGADFGTPIMSTNDGVVVMSGLYLVRGNLVVVDHGAGIFSLYGHMQERAVSVGEWVSRGQVLGYVGSTGLSTGAHLHWELSVGGVLVDGLRWLDGSQGF